ncbi:hypothetical protein CYMTET_36522 [Cymbomonas tetramitiformis]|uniref:Uncharacterized protein n=1 Tax=Cymbomonas tetramitiformis TaxID=36881 RepID=A0AAE0F6Z0_9CHLO|nr:hypothetical protein CYMTET_36709 [Cymbomonas tetramitiformis]KAK3254260.1 hypothetical protein CYMTET_36522 [Cymbomonas tetramitiformis]
MQRFIEKVGAVQIKKSGSLNTGQPQEKREIEHGAAYFRINAVARNTRSSCETTVKYSTIKAYLAALRDLHLELECPLPEFEDLKRLRRTLQGIKRLTGNPKCKKLLVGPKQLIRIFFGGKVDLSRENDLSLLDQMPPGIRWLLQEGQHHGQEAGLLCPVRSHAPRGVKFHGKGQMEVAAGFSKTNQFAERERKALFQTVRYSVFCATTLTRKMLALNKLPGSTKAPVLSYRKAVDEYHEMTQEQRLAIPKLVADSMEAAVDACC